MDVAAVWQTASNKTKNAKTHEERKGKKDDTIIYLFVWLEQSLQWALLNKIDYRIFRFKT